MRHHDDKSVVLYYHGGAYRNYYSMDHYPKNVASRVAIATGLPVLAIDYRIAPEHKTPTNTIKDAIDGIAYLKKQGFEKINLIGDSAGAGVAIAALGTLLESKKQETSRLFPFVRKAVLLSPCIDLTMNQKSFTENRFDWDTLRGDLFFTGVANGGTVDDDKKQFRKDVSIYAADIGVEDWRVSPVFIPDNLLQMFPPILQLLGEQEYVVEENRKFQERARYLGVDLRYREYPWMWHDFINYIDLPKKLQLSSDELPEAVACYDLIKLFVSED